MYLTPPLKKLKLTQPFGVDWTGVDLYRKLGMLGHNGMDFSAPTGTEVFACMAGELYVDYTAPVPGIPQGFKSGYGVNVRIRNRDAGLEAVYGHLDRPVRTDGSKVAPGELIALSDDTGISNGPHLHWGIRPIEYRNGAGPYYPTYENGYFGYIDPAPYLQPDAFALPVDRGYGVKPLISDFEWYKTAAWFWKEIARIDGKRRLPTTREKNAFVRGAWDFRTVADPAMFPIWVEITKPEAIRRGIIKKI